MNKNRWSVTNTGFDMTAHISSQSYYDNSGGVWHEFEIMQSQITLLGLDHTNTYDLYFFKSISGVGDNRTAKFIVYGKNAKTLYLKSANNTDKTICVSKIQSDSNVDIAVAVTGKDKNDNKSGFYYLNAMKLAPGE